MPLTLASQLCLTRCVFQITFTKICLHFEIPNKCLLLFTNNFIMKLKKDTTEPISFRIDKGLKGKLQVKFGKKLSEKIIPFLEKLVKTA